MALGSFDRTPPPFFRQGPSALSKLLFFSALALLLMAADTRLKLAQPLRAVVATVLVPVQRLLLVPVAAWGAAGDYLGGLQGALASERAARAELVAQAERAARAAQLAQENDRLRSLLELRPALAVRSVAADVLYEASDPYSRKVVIDRGSAGGVVLGAPVINEQGVLGQVTRVDMEVNFQEPRWRHATPEFREEDVDWAQFLFGRSERPFDARRIREWQLFRDYTNGLPGLWMSHFIDLVPWFTGRPYPLSAVASGGVYLWKDGRETEDTFQALLEYPGGLLVRWAMSLTNASPANRNLWYGTRGVLDCDALRITGEGSKDPRRVTADIAVERVQAESHMENFLRCVRSRKTPRADIQAGFSHAVAGIMSAEALRTGRRVTFDATRLELV